jgi:elongation factor 1-gamma
VAKASNLHLDLVTITSSQEAPESYRKLNPLGKIPTLATADGFILTECIAIAIYSASLFPHLPFSPVKPLNNITHPAK